jgi:hypothetical protein
MEAVAVDVLEEGPGAGVRGRKAGGRLSFVGAVIDGAINETEEGCSSRILRRDRTVSFARQLSSDDEDDDDCGISRIGGHRCVSEGGGGGEAGRLGVTDRDRDVFDPDCL